MFTATLLATALAAAPSGGLVVLMQRDADADAAWEQVVRGGAKSVVQNTRALKWVSAPDADLEDTQLMLGCAALDANCISQIAGLVGAKVALWARIGAEPGGAELSLSLVNSKGKELVRAGPYELTGSGAKSTAKKIIRSVLKERAPTLVVIDSSPPGASVSVDGAAKGKAPAVLLKVKPGQREVSVALDGHLETKRTINVQKGRGNRTTLTLRPGTANTPDPILDPDPEDPEDPKDPMDPKDPQDPQDPKDPKDPKDPGLGKQPNDPGAAGPNVVPWVVIGAGVAVAALGAGSFAYYYSAHSGLDEESPQVDPEQATPTQLGIYNKFVEENACAPAGRPVPAACQDEWKVHWENSVNPFFYAGYALTIIGSVAVASGAGLLLLE